LHCAGSALIRRTSVLAAVWQFEAADQFAPLDSVDLRNLPQVQTYLVPAPLIVLPKQV
jgi:hypothetical protein